MNIVTSFIAAISQKNVPAPISYALAQIKEATGREFTHSRLREYENGTVKMAPEVYNFMLTYVLTNDIELQAAFQSAGGDQDLHTLIAYKVKMPNFSKGKG